MVRPHTWEWELQVWFRVSSKGPDQTAHAKKNPTQALEWRPRLQLGHKHITHVVLYRIVYVTNKACLLLFVSTTQ